MALSNEFVNVTSREGSLEKKHDVLNHVFVGDEIKKGGEGLNGLGTEVLEFGDQLELNEEGENIAGEICSAFRM